MPKRKAVDALRLNRSESNSGIPPSASSNSRWGPRPAAPVPAAAGQDEAPETGDAEMTAEADSPSESDAVTTPSSQGSPDRDAPGPSGNAALHDEGYEVEKPSISLPPPRSAYKIPGYIPNHTMRLYAGPLRKWDRRQALINTVYGPREEEVRMFHVLQQFWDRSMYPASQSVAVKRLENAVGDDVRLYSHVMTSPWIGDEVEAAQEEAHDAWRKKYYAAMLVEGRRPYGATQEIDEAAAAEYLPYDVVHPDANVDILPQGGPVETLRAGTATLRPNSGGIFNAGGNVVSLAWAPVARNRQMEGTILAVAVLPHGREVGEKEGRGSIQLWRVPLKNNLERAEETKETDKADHNDEATEAKQTEENGQATEAEPSGGSGQTENTEEAPDPRSMGGTLSLYRVYCFDWGWPKRLEWCPVPTPLGGTSWPGLLAVLAEDGMVHIIKPKPRGAEGSLYAKIFRPMASLGFPNEEGVDATCMSWVGVNRIVVGYSDGTIVLWSIYPKVPLQRIQTHTSAIQDVQTAYPSNPYLVAIRPVDGVLRLIDLTRPSNEHTFHPSSVAAVQGNLLDWVEHMQGFASAGAMNSPVSNKLDFMHHRHFPCPRRFFPSRRESPPTCLSAGKVHPFVLVGSADGKVWACNLISTVFPLHWESTLPASTLILESEFRPLEKPSKSPSSTGKPPSPTYSHKNDAEDYLSHEHAEDIQTPQHLPTTHRTDDAERPGPKPIGGVQFRTTFVVDHNTKADPVEDDAMDVDEPSVVGRREPLWSSVPSGPSGHIGLMTMGPILHEKKTAISAIAWNPDLIFGTHYAVGMASGLVLIKELDGTV